MRTQTQTIKSTGEVVEVSNARMLTWIEVIDSSREYENLSEKYAAFENLYFVDMPAATAEDFLMRLTDNEVLEVYEYLSKKGTTYLLDKVKSYIEILGIR